MLLLLVAPSLAADTVTLTYAADAQGPAALRCVGERERRIGEKGTKNRMELRVVPRVEKVGASWALGTERIDVLSSEPPPPPGAPAIEAILARVEELMPDMLLDERGRWVGVEEISPEKQDAALTAMLLAANLPPPMVERLKGALQPALGADAIRASLREGWYTHTGHWLDRTLAIGGSETGEAQEGDALSAGTALTWGVTRRTACGGAEPASCVELRLEAKPPADEGVAQASAFVGGVAQALGAPAGDVRVASASVTTTWTSVVDPATLTAWSTERRRLTDATLTVGGNPVEVHSADVFRCVGE